MFLSRAVTSGALGVPFLSHRLRTGEQVLGDVPEHQVAEARLDHKGQNLPIPTTRVAPKAAAT